MRSVIVINYDGFKMNTVDKSIVFEGDKISASDGYHTFDELYEHRIELYIALLLHYTGPRSVWKSKKHNDGSSFEGYFILGIGTKKGEQITYHIPLSYWDEVAFAETFETAPCEFDGHTSNDVLKRLRIL